MFWWDDPIFFILIAAVVAIFLRRRWLSIGVAATFMIISLTPLSMWLVRALEGTSLVEMAEGSGQVRLIPQRQAIVVLTGGTVQYYPALDRYEWSWAVDRATEAIRLFKKGAAPWILVTGTERKPEHAKREVDSIAQLAHEWGVAESALVLEDKARNTYENALYASEILKAKGVTDFYVVTSAFHMRRAILCFRRQGLEPVPYPVDFAEIPAGSHQWIVTPGRKWYFLAVFLHETIGMLWYKLNGRI